MNFQTDQILSRTKILQDQHFPGPKFSRTKILQDQIFTVQEKGPNPWAPEIGPNVSTAPEFPRTLICSEPHSPGTTIPRDQIYRYPESNQIFPQDRFFPGPKFRHSGERTKYVATRNRTQSFARTGFPRTKIIRDQNYTNQNYPDQNFPGPKFHGPEFSPLRYLLNVVGWTPGQ